MARLKTLRLDYNGIGELLNSQGVLDNLTSRMEQALAMAQSQAPVDTGAYRASLRIEPVQRKDRVGVMLLSDIKYGFAVEADTGNLSRALSQARR